MNPRRSGCGVGWSGDMLAPFAHVLPTNPTEDPAERDAHETQRLRPVEAPWRARVHPASFPRCIVAACTARLGESAQRSSGSGTSMLRRRQAPYDVCIIGSGAGGGMAAYALTRAGARVVMLEAGPAWYASKDSQMLTPSYATPLRGRATHTRPFGGYDACDGGWEIDGEP